jgi:phage terminase small subunit
MPKPPSLNLRQTHFAEAYARHRNGSRAAREAGYSAKGRSDSSTAKRMFANARVMERIRTLEADTESALAYDKAMVLQGLLDAFAIAKERRKPTTMIAAFREIGNILGYFPPKAKQENTKPAKHPAEPNIMLLPDAELIARIEKMK